jgi:hypothetical protein
MANKESRPIIVQMSAMSQPLKSPTQANTIDKNNTRMFTCPETYLGRNTKEKDVAAVWTITYLQVPAV